MSDWKTEAFLSCLARIEEATGDEIEYDSIEDIFASCEQSDLILFVEKFTQDRECSEHDRLQKKVAVKMDLRDLIKLALDLEELRRLRGLASRYADATKAYQESADRQDRKAAAFTRDMGLTDGRRHAKMNEFMIFVDYLCAINGSGCEPMNKRAALEMVAKKYGIQSHEAVVSHLKRYLKTSKRKFPGILP
ncbi:MAG: hypothetical protein ACOWWM_16300 [Desulfobacterales bacterium]